MNCPACGAPNETDAQFCAECGSPLENNETEATIAGQKWSIDPESADPGIDEPVTVSEADENTGDLPVVPESTVVGQFPSPTTPPEPDDQPDEPSPSSIEDEAELPESPETAEPEAEVSPKEVSPGANGGSSRKVGFIVGVVALLFIIICCCCSVFVGAMFGLLTSELGQEILRELGAISVHWPVA